MATSVPVTMDTLITIKISIQGSNRKFKIPMRDLGAGVLPAKVSDDRAWDASRAPEPCP